jgi:hypothetical protein
MREGGRLKRETLPGALPALSSAILVTIRTFLSDTGSVRGNEFVRRIQALGKERGVEVHWTAHRGKGSHGLLYYGSNMTTVRNL